MHSPVCASKQTSLLNKLRIWQNPEIPMRLNGFIVIAFAGIVGLAGCKPKETTISGQVFIATSGGVNIRLGAVEIMLLNREDVLNYLQKEQLGIKDKFRLEGQAKQEELVRDLADAASRVPACQRNLAIAEAQVEVSQQKFNQTKLDYDQFMASNPLLTNAAYVKTKQHLADQAQLIQSKQQSIKYMQGELQRYSIPGKPVWVIDAGTKGHWVQPDETVRKATYKAYQRNLVNAQTELANLYAQIELDKQALGKMEHDVNEFQAAKLSEAERQLNRVKSDVTQAQRDLAAAKSRLDALKNAPPIMPSKPQLEDFLVGFKPPIVKKVNSDADGNFSLTYPQNKKFTIFAQATRSTLSGPPERYFWLIDAPVKAEGARVLLNNNNLVEVDPDGYFKAVLK